MNRRLLAMAAVPIALTTAYALWAFEHRWIGEWNWTIDSVTGSTVLTGPLVAAVAAWLAMDGARLAPLTSATPRAGAIPWRQAAQVWGVGTGCYVAAATLALLTTAVSVHGGPAELWALLIGPAVLAACVLVGTTAGSLAPYRVTAGLTGVGVFVLGAFGPRPLAGLLRHGPTTGSLAGLRYDPAGWVAQLVALVGIAVLLAGALPLLVGRRARPAPVALVVLGVVLAAGGLAGTGRTTGDRFLVSSERPVACRGEHPTVCLAPSNRVLLERAADGLHQGVRMMRAKGLEPPARYEQLLPGYQPPVSAGLLVRLPQYGASTDRSWIWAGLLRPAACAFWTDPDRPPPDAVFEAQALLEAWIVKGERAAETAWSAEARTWLAGAGTQEARTWARTTYDALRSCEVAAVVLPYPPSG